MENDKKHMIPGELETELIGEADLEHHYYYKNMSFGRGATLYFYKLICL